MWKILIIALSIPLIPLENSAGSEWPSIYHGTDAIFDLEKEELAVEGWHNNLPIGDVTHQLKGFSVRSSVCTVTFEPYILGPGDSVPLDEHSQPMLLLDDDMTYMTWQEFQGKVYSNLERDTCGL